MCGIVVTDTVNGHRLGILGAGLDSIAHRGPDARGVLDEAGWRLGHLRLAVIDPEPRSDQPMVAGDTVLAWNGELFDYRAHRASFAASSSWDTEGDTEVVAHLLDGSVDLGATLRSMDFMGAAVWVRHGTLHATRDRYGQVPLYVARFPDGGWALASEARALLAMGCHGGTVAHVPPATLLTIRDGDASSCPWDWPPIDPVDTTLDQAAGALHDHLALAVERRVLADVPVALLLSGGLDSSAIAGLLAASGRRYPCYIAVHEPKARDLRCARDVAELHGLDLRVVHVPPPTAENLATVVRAIELPAKAQVEIGWACLLLAEQMRADGIKVVLSGEGSDELWASYGMSYHGIVAHGWHEHRHRKILGQHRKNFARVNKVFMACGIEARLPFLHAPLVEHALSLPKTAVRAGRDPKAVLTRAVRHVIPDSVATRPKAAFQTDARIDRSAAAAVASPARFYRAVHAAHLPGCRL